MIMTGAAAGLAAAFNTPLGGIVFAVEELTKTHISYFRTALFSAVIIAGLTAQSILGPYLYLGFPAVNGLTTFVFAAVIVTAIVAGIAGSAMARLILKIMDYKAALSSTRQWLLIVFCGVTIACLAYFLNGVVLGSGKEVMTSLLFTNEKK
jgi:H+/Cl- antiporter ClcA